MEVFIVMYRHKDSAGEISRCRTVHDTESGAMAALRSDLLYYSKGLEYAVYIDIYGAFCVSRGDTTIEESVIRREVRVDEATPELAKHD